MATKAGPLMRRHEFDGHSYIVPADAVFDGRIAACDDCDATGTCTEITAAGHEVPIDCPICEGAGWIGPDGIPIGDD